MTHRRGSTSQQAGGRWHRARRSEYAVDVSRTPPTEWQLFLDESGRLDGSELSVVAGVLVPHARSTSWDRDVREGLRRVFPAVPYPPHASTLAYPASRVVGCMLSPAPASEDEARIHARCQPAIDALRRDPESREFVAAADRGEWPTHSMLSAASARLRREAPAAEAALRAIMEEQDRTLARLLRTTLASDGCAVVGAAHLPEEDGAPSARADRYLSVVEAALERVVALLRGRDASPVKLWVQVEARHVPDPTLGTNVPLQSAPLADVARRALASPWFEPTTELRIVPDRPERKSPSLHPGIVLADFASHRLRRRLNSGASYDAVRTWVENDLGMDLARVPRFAGAGEPLPTVAALGVPRDAITAAIERRAPVALERVRARWARDQARRWVAAVRRCEP